ncbi:RNA polymerase sigma factor [Exilibacterium tricleocarpae]|uniref:RNA polymerase sigma factor n=1 Tax=Exilibacterium tricleocarpae TaxID=2591008 RepID=A0A545SY32_9GAMM|nr:RNA polymerase sigma factor [Exilibacterium tricleocarpae]TQV69871.1 RNA polymerase sigma factor [Exilibacterium tricleocarpae]
MESVFNQYHSMLLSFFSKRSQNTWDAEELTQEVFYKMLKRDEIDANQPYPESYLYTIAWSVLRDRSRRDRVRQRGQHVVYDESLAKEDPHTPERDANSREIYQRYVQILNDLSPKARAVFVLHRYEGLTYTQIAKHCDMSVSAVEKHMMKALAQMKELLRDHV